MDEELLRACQNVRDRNMAEMVTLIIGIAAETHPEELRVALGKVFDVSAVEESTTRLMVVLSTMQTTAADMRDQLGLLQGELDRFERRLGAVERTEESLEGQYRQLKARLDKAASVFAKLRATLPMKAGANK